MNIDDEASEGAIRTCDGITYAWASNETMHEFCAMGRLRELRKLWRKE
jgi:hypothetical protein